jgi:hypothetical protein
LVLLKEEHCSCYGGNAVSEKVTSGTRCKRLGGTDPESQLSREENFMLRRSAQQHFTVTEEGHKDSCVVLKTRDLLTLGLQLQNDFIIT